MADFVIRLDSAGVNELLNETTGLVARDLYKRALRVERAAKRNAPVDTGRLRSSIGTSMGNDNRGLYAKVGSKVEYALWQEMGTRRMRAHPYLRPALNAAGNT